MVINIVAGITASGKKKLHEYPHVVSVDRTYTNLANITQYLEAVIPTLNYEIWSTSRSTVSMKKENIPCPSAFFNISKGTKKKLSLLKRCHSHP